MYSKVVHLDCIVFPSNSLNPTEMDLTDISPQCFLFSDMCSVTYGLCTSIRTCHLCLATAANGFVPILSDSKFEL